MNRQKPVALVLLLAAVVPWHAYGQPRPLVIFVTGKQWSCNAPPLSSSQDRVVSLLRSPGIHDDRGGTALDGAEVMSTSWNCFHDGATECGVGTNRNSLPGSANPGANPGFPSSGGCTWASSDDTFRKDLGAFLANNVPQGRRVIVIGHSFGGDSLLRAINGSTGAGQVSRTVNNPVYAVFTLDPVGFGGTRRMKNATYHFGGSAGVKHFFNRWQQNLTYGYTPYLTPYECPFNYQESGALDWYGSNCGPTGTQCDQLQAFSQRNENGTDLCYGVNGVTTNCSWWTQPLLANHSSLSGSITMESWQPGGQTPGGAWIQREETDKLRAILNGRVIANFRANVIVNGSMPFVSADNGGGGQLHTNRFSAGTAETFELINNTAGLGTFRYGDDLGIAASSGHFWSSQPGPFVVDANRYAAAQWEGFRLEAVNKPAGSPVANWDWVNLTDWQGRYVCAQPTGSVDQRLITQFSLTVNCSFQVNFNFTNG